MRYFHDCRQNSAYALYRMTVVRIASAIIIILYNDRIANRT